MADSLPSRYDPIRHWDEAYVRSGTGGVSWFQESPQLSLELIRELGVPANVPVVDIGAGASTVVDSLIVLGYRDVTVLDVSSTALASARDRVGPTQAVTWLEEDLLTWCPAQKYMLWHDRAVFHFFVDTADRTAYLDTLRNATAPGAAIIIATFAPEGPKSCSGLPVARYSASELFAILGDGFEPVIHRQELHTTPSGGTQPFTWVAARRRDTAG